VRHLCGGICAGVAANSPAPGMGRLRVYLPVAIHATAPYRGHAPIIITTLPLMVDGLVSCHAAAPHPTHHPTVWRPVVMVVLGGFFTWLIIVGRTWCFIRACPLPFFIIFRIGVRGRAIRS